MRISLVVLTYNEIVGLRAVFDRIPLKAVDEIFAVDGGSTDGTVEFFREKGVVVHSQEIKGRGEAFRVAFRKATGDALLFFSPDGNEDPDDIPKFRPYLEQGYDMVVGTRMVKGARNEEDHLVFKWRKWANNAFNLMANATWNRGPFVTDTINGFRAITKKAWGRLALDGPGYTIEYQSSIRAFKLGLRVAEFPTLEAPRIDEREGSPSVKTGLAFLKLYFSEVRLGKRSTSL
jgi:glycosyltransferase involved in cell wall biosynthesis